MSNDFHAVMWMPMFTGSRRGLKDFLITHGTSAVQVLTIESEDLHQVPHGVSQHKFVQGQFKVMHIIRHP